MCHILFEDPNILLIIKKPITVGQRENIKHIMACLYLTYIHNANLCPFYNNGLGDFRNALLSLLGADISENEIDVAIDFLCEARLIVPRLSIEAPLFMFNYWESEKEMPYRAFSIMSHPTILMLFYDAFIMELSFDDIQKDLNSKKESWKSLAQIMNKMFKRV